MKLQIEIEMGNAAFQDNGPYELARILEDVKRKVFSLGEEPLPSGFKEKLFDSNGNTVGKAEVTD